MSRYLLVKEEKYRVDMEAEVDTLIDELKSSSNGELISYTSTRKVTKDDEYFVVKTKVKYNDEKNPTFL